MENEFVPYEIAFELKEIGFNEPCCARYYYEVEDNKLRFFQPNYARDFNFVTINLTGQKNNDKPLFISVPTFSQAFRWFREKYGLSCSIELTDNSRDYYYDFIVYDSKNRDWNDVDCFDSCKSIYGKEKYRNYEEAELECLKKLIEIVKKK